jgi:hypothetical protein
MLNLWVHTVEIRFLVIDWLESLCQRVIDWHPTRRVLESFLRRRTQIGLHPLEKSTLERSQTRVLRGLIHQARHTRYGRDQDFARIRTVADFRRLVPLRSPGDLLKQYWEPVFPWIAATTWPEVQRIVERSLPQCAYLPLTAAFVGRAAEVWLAGLAQVMRAHPHRHLLGGRILGLVEPMAEPLIDAAWGQFPWTLRPYLSVRHAGQIGPEDARTPTTCLLASRSQFTVLIQRLREQFGAARLTEFWPALCGVVLLRSPLEEPLPAELEQAVPSLVARVEIVVEPEGILALEDLQRGTLRLLPECGVYHELIPVEERERERPQRYGLHEALSGRIYELITTTAGLWACRTGVGVCFDSIPGQAVRFQSLPALEVPVPPPMREPEPTGPMVSPLKPPRLRHLPGPALPLPSNLVRMPWSTSADR